MQTLFTQSPSLLILITLVFALLVGSFLNVVIYRMPLMVKRSWREQCEEISKIPTNDIPQGRFNLIAPRSRCPHCSNPITAMQNIPLLSYFMLNGKCAACGTDISIRYPIIELLTGALTAAVAWHFGFGWEALAAICITWVLIVISAIDIDQKHIYDDMVLPFLWSGLLISVISPVEGVYTLFIEPTDAIAGALVGYLSLWSVYHIFRLITGKEGMGYGDFKLLAALGAWLGWQLVPFVIFISAIAGSVVGIVLILLKHRESSTPIPFGPYISAAGWIAMLWGNDIMTFYLSYIA